MAEINRKFIKFVQSKKNQPTDDFNIKDTSKPFNKAPENLLKPNTKENKTESSTDTSISDLLKQFSGKVIAPKNNFDSHDNKIETDSSSSDNESDYETEKINHYVSKRENKKFLNREARDYPEDNDYNIPIFPKKEERIREKEQNKQNAQQRIEKKQRHQDSNKYTVPRENEKIRNTNMSHLNNNLNTVFIGNLPLAIDEERIKKELKAFGKISSVRLMKHKDGKSKGFGYVDFQTEKSLSEALNAKDIKIEGKEIKIEKAKSSFSDKVYTDSQQRLGKKKQRSIENKKRFNIES